MIFLTNGERRDEKGRQVRTTDDDEGQKTSNERHILI